MIKHTWKRGRTVPQGTLQVAVTFHQEAEPRPVFRAEQGSRVIEFGLTLSELANLVDTLHTAYSEACRVAYGCEPPEVNATPVKVEPDPNWPAPHEI